MKKITKEYTLYTVNELSQEARDKAREKFNENNQDLPYLKETMVEDLIMFLGDNKITQADNCNLELLYSLSYCQGDGVMFSGKFLWEGYQVDIKHSGHYYHENSKILEIYRDEGDEQISMDADESIYKKFNNIYINICKQLEKNGYAHIEEEFGEESFISTCEANDYTFLKDGTMMNE